MGDDHFLQHVDDQREAIHVNRNQYLPVMRKTESIDIRPVLEGEGFCYICGQIVEIDFVPDWGEEHLIRLLEVGLACLL